ncbi:hypothetical protein D3C73_967950 [compost metagenome]
MVRGVAVVGNVEVQRAADAGREQRCCLADFDDGQALAGHALGLRMFHGPAQSGAQVLDTGRAHGGAGDGGGRARNGADLFQRNVATQQGSQVQADTANGMDDLRVVGIVTQQRVPDIQGTAHIVVLRGYEHAGGVGPGISSGGQSVDRMGQQRCGVRRTTAQFGDQGLRQQPAVGCNLAQRVQRKAITQTVQQRVHFQDVTAMCALVRAGGDGVGQGGMQPSVVKRIGARRGKGTRYGDGIQKREAGGGRLAQADAAKAGLLDGGDLFAGRVVEFKTGGQ